MKKLHGVTVAMVTPIDDNDRILDEAIKKHVDFLIEKGVNCLYPLGTTGEMHLLTIEERKRVAETVVEHAAGRVTVYIHIGAMRQEDTIKLAKHASEIGADGIGVVTPTFFSVDDREMEEYFVSVANSVPDDFPVYLYNIPQCSANDLKPNVIENIIKRAPNVVGIKYSYPDFIRTSQYLRINNGNFSVVHGTDRLFNSILSMGCDGVVSGNASAFPEPFVAIYKAFKEKNLEEAKRQQKIATDISNILKNGSNMAYFKSALKLRGIDVGHVRKPLLDLNKVQLEELESKIKPFIDRAFCFVTFFHSQQEKIYSDIFPWVCPKKDFCRVTVFV